MENLTLFEHFLFSFITSSGFGVFLSVPKKDVFIGGLIGGISWLLYIKILWSTGEVILPYFLATVSIGILGDVFSKITRRPVIVYLIPAALPLVPGYTMYYTMLYTVTEKYELAIAKGVEAIFIAFAIATALVVTESLRKVTSKIFYELYLKKYLKYKNSVKF